MSDMPANCLFNAFHFFQAGFGRSVDLDYDEAEYVGHEGFPAAFDADDAFTLQPPLQPTFQPDSQPTLALQSFQPTFVTDLQPTFLSNQQDYQPTFLSNQQDYQPTFLPLLDSDQLHQDFRPFGNRKHQLFIIRYQL